MKKITWIFSLFLIFGVGIFIWWKFYFVFGEGVKAGTLNYFVRKGVIFKTYEGRLVQEGFQSSIAGGLQSNEFKFSVVDSELAKILERSSGRLIELRYQEYNGMLPWRGVSTHVVIEVLTSDELDKPKDSTLPYTQ